MEENNNNEVEEILEENNQEEKQEEVKDDFDEIKEMQKTQELKKIEDSTENLDKTFVKEVREAEATSSSEKKSGSKIAAVCAILLLIGILCLGALYGPTLLKNFDKKNSKKETVETKKKEYRSEYRLSGNGLEDFDLYFLKLEEEAKNKVYSPLSIKYALAMLSEGAKGETKEQIDALIGDYQAKKYPNNEHMSFANAMFIRNTFQDKVKSSYINSLKEKYDASVEYPDFSSSTPMNDWVSNKTFKLVNNLLDDDTVSKANFFLVNALAIDMNWKNQVHCALGHDTVPCYNNDGITSSFATYSIRYYHEKVKDDDEIAYSVTSYPYQSEEEFYGYDYNKHVFNGKDKTKGAHVLADYNKYDIIKELGEDKIRSEVGAAYQEWLKDPRNSEYAEKDINKYLDQYISELKSNYGKKQNSTDFLVYEDETVKSFAKDLQTYDGVTLQYVGIMPKNEDLTSYIKNIKAKELNEIVKNLKEVNIDNFKEGVVTIVRGFIPFFQYEYELKLLEDLQKLGIKDIFDVNKADLSNMLDGEKNYIFDARHKANIEFSNDGIKAAAATSMGGFGSTSGGFEYLYKVPVEEVDVTFDKPYMYIIRDKESGEVWFTGEVFEPIHK